MARRRGARRRRWARWPTVRGSATLVAGLGGAGLGGRRSWAQRRSVRGSGGARRSAARGSVAGEVGLEGARWTTAGGASSVAGVTWLGGGRDSRDGRGHG
ncbi:hypothetical protein GUJ93_ZPchr0005g14936 [Zizania palustris]|uniref:Uncharacterized protein n=1 Tax=Zizania palustris TaxID=103762 RepID=A0A8J5VFY3_ZIZPA|nr:hypothetical protein GUJ93_ZPchr0005g14936 [Zizania palustris]